MFLKFEFKNSTFLLFPKHFSFCFYVQANLWYWQKNFQNISLIIDLHHTAAVDMFPDRFECYCWQYPDTYTGMTLGLGGLIMDTSNLLKKINNLKKERNYIVVLPQL